MSIVVTVYNGGPHFPTCFASLCKLSYPADRLEIHLVDDCSMDGTREFLQGQSAPDFLHLHFPDTNLGRTRACNLALAQTTGEVVIFLDGDMEVQPDFVDQHLAELAKPGREAVVGLVKPAAWIPRTKLNRYMYDYSRRGARQFGPDTPIDFQYLAFNNAALSHAAVDSGGLFEESFRHFGGKDILFAYRLAQRFPRGIYYSDKPVAYHHHDRSLGTYMALLRQYGYYNLPQIISQHPELATILAADYAWPLPGNHFRYKRMAGKVLFSRVIRSIIRGLLIVTPSPLSGMLVRFLLVSAVVQGLRKHVREHRVEPKHSPKHPDRPKR
ncbi:MAG: glycosyltransferase family 2 protein [Fidelibacterota bacterium]|nr:MAG: glycosyltransferase family 2 protein [Candidatus Neomarinimicrobiota bacterium]